MSLLSILRNPPPISIRRNQTIRTFTDGSNPINVNSRAPPKLPRPPPGRLSRRPRDDDDAAAKKAVVSNSSGDTNLKKDADYVRQLRINERKAAIERRRLFLEKGTVMAEETTPNNNNIDEVTNFTNVESNYTKVRTDTQRHSPKVARSSVHSLNQGRTLSAADRHRLERSTSRRFEPIQPMPHQQQQQYQEQKQQVQLQQQQLQLEQQITPKTNNRVEHRLTRESKSNPTGGSLVASQSATTRYRLQRQQLLLKDAAFNNNNINIESNTLKMNPSVISIPLDESSELDSRTRVDDFEERLKRLRRGKEREEDDSSWFGWLWKK